MLFAVLQSQHPAEAGSSGCKRHRMRHYRTPPHESTVLLFSSFLPSFPAVLHQLCLLHPVGAQKPHSPRPKHREREEQREGSALRYLIISRGFFCSRAGIVNFFYCMPKYHVEISYKNVQRMFSNRSLQHFRDRTRNVLLIERIFASEISEGK